jgi:hypothetical protein
MAMSKPFRDTPTQKFPLGHAKNNKEAKVYETNGASADAGNAPMKAGEYAYTKSAKDAAITDPVPNGVSYGVSKEPKTDGITMRGYGAATKGIKSRGSMA